MPRTRLRQGPALAPVRHDLHESLLSTATHTSSQSYDSALTTILSPAHGCCKRAFDVRPVISSHDRPRQSGVLRRQQTELSHGGGSTWNGHRRTRLAQILELIEWTALPGLSGVGPD